MQTSANEVDTCSCIDSRLTAASEDDTVSCLHQPYKMAVGLKSRKSVIKHSTARHTDGVQIGPKPLDMPPIKVPLGLPADQSDDVEYSSSSSLSSVSSSSEDSSDSVKSSPRHKYLPRNFLIDSSAAEFAGKLKVKWREKYENLESGYESVEGVGPCTRNLGKKTAIASGRKNSKIISLRNSPMKRRSQMKNSIVGTRMLVSMQNCVEMIPKVDEAPLPSAPMTRKLERTRKGLLYQNFMANTYSWCRKDRK